MGFREDAKAEGYTDAEIDNYLQAQGRGAEARATSPSPVTYSRTGVRSQAGAEVPYQGAADAPEGPMGPFDLRDPTVVAGSLLAGPVAEGAQFGRAFLGNALARMAGRGVESAAPGLGSSASRAAEAVGEYAMHKVPGASEANLLRRVFGALRSPARAASEPAIERTAQAGGRMAKEAVRQFGKGATVTENGSRYVIRDAGGVKIGSGDTFQEAIKAGHENLGTARKAFRGPKVPSEAPKPMGRVVGEIKPRPGTAASRVMSAEEQAAARARGREISPTKSPNAMAGKSNAKLAREAAYRAKLKGGQSFENLPRGSAERAAAAREEAARLKAKFAAMRKE